MSETSKRADEKSRISISDYRLGKKCLKALWRKTNDPESFHYPALDPHIAVQGAEIRALGKSLLGVEKTVPEQAEDEMIRITKEWMEQGVHVIGDACFLYEDCYCRVDALVINEDQSLELYRISAAAGVRDFWVDEFAFSLYILKGLGYRVRRCWSMHINTGYVRHGALEIERMFLRQDLTRSANRAVARVKEFLPRIRRAKHEKTEPYRRTGEFCRISGPCCYFDLCFPHLPERNVFELGNMSLREKMELYHSGLSDLRLLAGSEILNEKQNLQASHEVFELPDVICREKIREFLKDFTLPLYFLDFESFQPAVPRFESTRPYGQIVFQYSLHILEKDGTLRHLQYLGEPETDPRPACARQLCHDIPKNACTVVYNMDYERARITEFADLYPELAEHLISIRDHILDLIIPFRSGWYYNRRMHGSHSLKAVVPALFPEAEELNYEHLQGVHDGLEASLAFLSMEHMDPEERYWLRRNLLDYCRVDTLALVRIYRKLTALAQEKTK